MRKTTENSLYGNSPKIPDNYLQNYPDDKKNKEILADYHSQEQVKREI